jgi:hypothetical protein
VKSIVLEYLQGAVDFYEEIAKKKSRSKRSLLGLAYVVDLAVSRTLV